MKKAMAKLLHTKADDVATLFSNKKRGGNVVKETYFVEKITVLSDVTAAVTFDKEPTGKKAVAWFYYINSKLSPRWEYFFVTYSHLVGLNRVSKLLHDVEQHNFSKSVET